MTRIRAAVETDAEALADLAAQLGYPADAASIAARLRDIDTRAAGVVLVAEADGGDVIGFAHTAVRPSLILDRYFELAALVVDDVARGTGVGAALLAAVEAWAGGHGFDAVRVRSNVIRERAHRFYLREGYVERKRQAVFVKSL